MSESFYCKSESRLEADDALVPHYTFKGEAMHYAATFLYAAGRAWIWVPYLQQALRVRMFTFHTTLRHHSYLTPN